MMNSENMFETAIRTKMRFPFKGMVSVEDLFDLTVENLDFIFKELNNKMKKIGGESLLNEKTSEDEKCEIQIEIIKYIVNLKIEEKNNRLKARAQKEQKQKILSVISEKQDADLKSKSIEELTAMLDKID